MTEHRAAARAARSRAAELLRAPDEPAPTTAASIDDIYRLVTAHTWRRSSVSVELAQDIRHKVADQVSRGAPVVFSIPFGGYKSWRQESFPHINWAEPMWIERLRRYGLSIAQAHPPGVDFEFTYYSHALDLVNNLLLEDQETYTREFESLLALRTGSRVRFHLVDLVTQHANVGEFRRDLIAAIDSHLAGRYQPTPRQMSSARRNLVPRGERDLAQLSESEVAELVIASARACSAMEGLPQRRAYNKGAHRIQLSHQSGSTLTLHISSTDVSIHQPWVGVGYLRNDGGNRWRDAIAGQVPPGQWHEIVGVDPSLGPGLEHLATSVLQ